MQSPPKAMNLCEKCSKIDFWAGKIAFTEKADVTSLEKESPVCDFCRLRRDLCKRLNHTHAPVVYFDRLESTLRLNENYPPVLTIHRGPGMSENLLITTDHQTVANVLTTQSRLEGVAWAAVSVTDRPP